MSDKPLIQQELAESLSKILLLLDKEVAVGYLGAFWKTVIAEWYGIDRIRQEHLHLILGNSHYYIYIYSKDPLMYKDSTNSTCSSERCMLLLFNGLLSMNGIQNY